MQKITNKCTLTLMSNYEIDFDFKFKILHIKNEWSLPSLSLAMRLAARLSLPDHSNSTTLSTRILATIRSKKWSKKRHTSRKTIIKNKGAGHYTSFLLSSLSLPLSNATCTLILSSSDYQFLRIALHFFIFKLEQTPAPPQKVPTG